MIEPYRVSTEAIRASVASLPDAGRRRDLAIALQALSQVVAVQDALGEQFDQNTVEVFGQGAVLLSYRVAQQERIIEGVRDAHHVEMTSQRSRHRGGGGTGRSAVSRVPMALARFGRIADS